MALVTDAVVVIIRAVPAEGGLSYIIILQHEGVDSQSAAVQVQFVDAYIFSRIYTPVILELEMSNYKSIPQNT